MEHIPYFDAHCDTIYRCLRTALQAMDLAQRDVLSLSFLDPLP